VTAQSPAEASRLRHIQELKDNLAELDRHTEAALAEEKRLRTLSDGYQKRAEMAPTRESELVELTRDYATEHQTYTNLLAKKDDAEIARNLERLQIGEQFKILDPARIPERPFSPDRQRLRLMAMALSLGMGLCWIALLEYRDSTFKTDVEAADVLSLPVLAVVPLMMSEPQRRRTSIRRWVVNAGLMAGVTASLAVLVYTFVR
jgi:uncharacterized protein involved in exopolysaccharide biosynthesis